MKIVFVTLCACVAVVSGVENDACAAGQAYWCGSLRNAIQCGALEHCKTVWANNVNQHQDGAEECSFCKTLIGEVKALISQAATEGVIEDFMDSACSVIPDASLASECKDLVNQYLPEILDLIKAELDPDTLCQLLGLCSGQLNKIVHLVPTTKVKDDQVCTDCKKLMTDIQKMITDNQTEQQLEQLLDNAVCVNLGALEDECRQMVASYLPEVLQLIAQSFDADQLCQLLGFCDGDVTALRARVLANVRRVTSSFASSSTCEVCESVVPVIKSMLADKNTQTEIENFLKSDVCALLGSLQTECEQTVDTYLPLLFQLVSTLDPDTICQELGLCSSQQHLLNSIRTGSLVMPAAQLLPAKPAQLPVKPVKASATCIVCEFVMRELDSMLADNATEGEIIAAVDKVCSILPSSIEKECLDFVKQYGPALIQLLESELDPSQICTALGLCSSSKHTLTKLPVSSELCGVCETLVQYIITLLEGNTTVAKIEEVLEKACNFLPATMKQECDTIVEQYGPLLIKLLAQYTNPEQICQALGLCNSASNQQPHVVPVKEHMLGVNECTYGPSYWCASQANAEQCQAVEHCQKHVWVN